MSFTHPEFLTLLAVVPLLYVIWRQQHLGGVRAYTGLAVRLTMTVALVLALSGLTVAQPLDRQAVVFVGDVSASTTNARAQQEQFIRDAVSGKRPDDAFAVVSTARTAQVEQILRTSGSFTGFQAQTDPNGTNLGAGLQAAGTLLPAAYKDRVVLMSDGQETAGDAVAQARLLAARGIQVDVLPLQVNNGPEVLVDQVSAPRLVHESERFSIVVHVDMKTVSTHFLDNPLHGGQNIVFIAEERRA